MNLIQENHNKIPHSLAHNNLRKIKQKTHSSFIYLQKSNNQLFKKKKEEFTKVKPSNNRLKTSLNRI